MVTLEKQDYQENRKLYEAVEQELKKTLGEGIQIFHVGSTAIPEIEYGKNIIDILIGAKSKEEFEKLEAQIEKMGYFSGKYSRTEEYQFYASQEDETKARDVHLHLALMGTERYDDFLILRDYLLSHEDEAKKYSDHKQKLLQEGITDRKEYRKAKSEYVSNLIQRARSCL